MKNTAYLITKITNDRFVVFPIVLDEARFYKVPNTLEGNV